MSKERLEEIEDKWDYAVESGKDGSLLTGCIHLKTGSKKDMLRKFKYCFSCGRRRKLYVIHYSKYTSIECGHCMNHIILEGDIH